jgi:hypothetical protein
MAADQLMGLPLVAGPRQHAAELAYSPTSVLDGSPSEDEGGKILVYDHDQDRIVEVSRLALWILHHLDGAMTPRQLAARLSEEEGVDLASLSAAVETVVAQLYERGFLVASTSRATASSGVVTIQSAA